ncbi:hypothetical protein QFX18_12695 [Saccharophagus degradans]|uniref:hypothetical protein n=1 Tax=Saccharophagus degradans TaxID=86304 RepID=UPI00247818FB|nr:hypothetical protein [Saccharophagus degradans]WGO96904.1 hypothetical protein QFX18_12695 [Saccharophagus degradans]
MESSIVYSDDPQTGEKRLQLRDGLTESVLNEVRKRKFDILWCYYGNFEALGEIDLSSFRGKLIFQSSEPQNVSWIGGLYSLESLSVRGKIKGKIDFSRMKALRSAEIDWCSSTKSIISSELMLRSLSLNKFSGLLSDFSVITSKKILTLGLTGSIESLDGIGQFTDLNSISLWNMKKLKDISGILECKKLKSFQVETCNSIENLNLLERLVSLEEMFFENRELSSLNQFPKENMKKIVLGSQTKIMDNDLEEFFKFPKLKKVSFPKKSGYKYSAEEVNKIIS